MAKLSLFSLTLTAIVAFSVVSAYRTTISTTTIDDNGMVFIFDHLDNHHEQCRSQIQTEQLNHCRMHLNQGIVFDKKVKMVVNQQEQHLQQCCRQLKQVSSQCQCDAIQQVFEEARLQDGGQRSMQQMASKALRLPNACRLEVKDCPLAVPRV